MKRLPSDFAHAFDVLALEGNDIERAQNLVNPLPTEDVFSARSRRAFLSHLSLQQEAWLDDALTSFVTVTGYN